MRYIMPLNTFRSNLLLFIWLVFSGSGLMAQQKEIDSLHVLLLKDLKEDTIRFDRLNDVAFYYCNIDPGKGLIYADQAIALAEKLGHKTRLAGGYSTKGINYNAMGKDSLALEMYHQALRLHEGSNNRLGEARTYNNMAIVYVDRSDYANALECHEKALKILQQLGDPFRIATSLTNAGVVHLMMSDYPKALEYYLEALSIYEKLKNKDVIANTLTNIGIVYKNLENYPLALAYHERALKIHTGSGNRQGEASSLANIGVVYDQLSNSAKALELYQQALVINESIGNNRRIASDLTNIGLIYKKQADYTNAMASLHKALALYRQTEDKNSLSIVLAEIGSIYLKAPAAILQKYDIPVSDKYTHAIDWQQRSLQLAIEIGALDRQAQAWEYLSETYGAKGDYRKALHAYKQYVVLQDSILNEKKTKEITRLEVKFEFEKEQAILNAEFEKKRLLDAAEIEQQHLIKRALMAGLAGLLLAATGIFVFYKKSRDAGARKKEAEFSMHVADTEMRVMRLQMNPHFIFNSLNAISDYISKHDTRAADTYLAKFAKVMRMILENSEQKEIPLGEELKALELYMQLESLRLPYPFTYEILVAEDVDLENTLIPPLILQPFVENSIWHGLSGRQSPGKIVIRIKIDDGMLHCAVEDNGIGRKHTGSVMAGKKSMGMKITRARIEIINRIRHTNATMELSDLEEGTMVIVKLPLELNN